MFAFCIMYISQRYRNVIMFFNSSNRFPACLFKFIMCCVFFGMSQKYFVVYSLAGDRNEGQVTLPLWTLAWVRMFTQAQSVPLQVYWSATQFFSHKSCCGQNYIITKSNKHYTLSICRSFHIFVCEFKLSLFGFILNSLYLLWDTR